MPETSHREISISNEQVEKPHIDSHHSELERNPEKLQKYVELLEQALGNGIKVVGILEIGSFANGEGMELSDIDTRVFVESDDAYVWNVDGHRSSEAAHKNSEKKLEKFTSLYGNKPVVNFTWTEFNMPVWKKLHEALGMQVEFGLVDKRYAEFELDNLESSPSNEHSFLTQSNVLYDPQHFLAGKKKELEGKVLPSMAQFYGDRFLNALPFEIYGNIDITEKDLADIRERHKIQWVKWAVRCVREAVATKSYSANGRTVHKKDDVLAFYKKYLPEKYDFVAMLYDWKINAEARNSLIHEALQDPQAVSQKFRELMPELEATVEAVKHLKL